MNENLINILLEQLPFSLNVMIQLISLSFFVLPLISAIYVMIAIYRRFRKKSNNKIFAAIILSTALCFTGIYITSTRYITTSISPYLIGENTIEDAEKHTMINSAITSTLTPLEIDELNECNKPVQVNGKYVSPRIFDLMQCLWVR